MPLNYWIHDCALEILGVDELHLDLRNYLDDIETNAGLAQGSIRSRQIVALAIVFTVALIISLAAAAAALSLTLAA